MLVSMIAAMDGRGLIGDENGLPWRLPNDLRRFRSHTWGKPIIMGRKTFEHIGKPLPGRLSIILSQNPTQQPPGCQVARTLQEGLSFAADHLATTWGNEAIIIGGGKVYAEAIHCWDRLYLTLVEGQFQGNTYFPVRELLQQRWRRPAPRNFTPLMRRMGMRIPSTFWKAILMPDALLPHQRMIALLVNVQPSKKH